MGTKISDMTLTGSAPTDSEIVIAYSGQNYKINPSALGGASGVGPRAYVAFDGTATNVTNSITNSFNISSITDNAVGQYTVNFSNPVENPVAVHDNGPRSDGFPIIYSDLYNVGSGSIKIGLGANNLWYDSAYISLVVF